MNPVAQALGQLLGEERGTGKDYDVKILQQLLINEGFWNSNVSVSSYFGQVTKQAVMLFQQKNSDQILKPLGLNAPTGFFGPYTRNYLNNNIFIDFGTGQSTTLCGNGRCDAGLGETADSCSQDCVKSANCYKEGEQIPNNPLNSTRCCDGLQATPYFYDFGASVCGPTPPGTASTGCTRYICEEPIDMTHCKSTGGQWILQPCVGNAANCSQQYACGCPASTVWQAAGGVPHRVD